LSGPDLAAPICRGTIRNLTEVQPAVSCSLNISQGIRTLKPKITYKCNYYGKRGHKAADRFKTKREENQKAGLVHEGYFSGKTNDKWCLDSECPSHICNDRELFIDSQKAQCQLKLASLTQQLRQLRKEA
jgi:hypothetical protein